MNKQEILINFCDHGSRSRERRGSAVTISMTSDIEGLHRSRSRSPSFSYARSLTPLNLSADYCATTTHGIFLTTINASDRSLSLVSIAPENRNHNAKQSLSRTSSGSNGKSFDTGDQQGKTLDTDEYLMLDEVQNQVYKAKANAQTVTTINGNLYIDYRYIGRLPPGYHV